MLASDQEQALLSKYLGAETIFKRQKHRVWRCTSLIPALGAQREAEFQASPVCTVSPRTGRPLCRDPVLKRTATVIIIIITIINKGKTHNDANVR